MLISSPSEVTKKQLERNFAYHFANRLTSICHLLLPYPANSPKDMRFSACFGMFLLIGRPKIQRIVCNTLVCTGVM